MRSPVIRRRRRARKRRVSWVRWTWLCAWLLELPAGSLVRSRRAASARARGSRGRLVPPRLEPRHAGHRDHGGIVRAELDAREVDSRALRAPPPSPAASRSTPVGADAAGHHQRVEAGLLQRAQRLADQRLDDGLLRRRRRCRRALRRSSAPSARVAFTASITAVFRPEKLNSSPARSSIGRGKSKRRAGPARPASPARGRPGYGRPSNLADLSKASPAASSRVSPSTLVLARPATSIEHGVPAGDQQRQVRERRRLGLQQRRQQVAFEVVDGTAGTFQA